MGAASQVAAHDGTGTVRLELPYTVASRVYRVGGPGSTLPLIPPVTGSGGATSRNRVIGTDKDTSENPAKVQIS